MPGIHFFPYQIEGGKIWHVTNASIQVIFFYLDMRGVNWMLDVGHHEISKENSKRWLEVRFRLQRLGARNLKL